jgi:hypothetical protein
VLVKLTYNYDYVNIESMTFRRELSVPQQDQFTGESKSNAEQLPRSPRVVIYGSRMSGGYNLRDEVAARLATHEVDGVEVYAIRDIANIDNAFFGRAQVVQDTGTSEDSQLELRQYAAIPELQNGKEGIDLLTHLGPVALGGAAETTSHDTLPLGVFVLSEMRQYHLDAGMSIPTPYGTIEDLCTEYDVPLVYAEAIQDRQALENAMAQHGVGAPTEQPAIEQ